MPPSVFIINSPILAKSIQDENKSVESIHIYSWPHPQTPETLAKYITIGPHILEIHTVNEMPSEMSPACTFIGNTIDNSGRFYICTPVDPMLLFLPYLLDFNGAIPSGGSSREIHDIININNPRYSSHPHLPHFRRFILDNETHLSTTFSQACDCTSIAGTYYYKFNWNKFQSWITTKIARLSSTLSTMPFIPFGLIPNPAIGNGKQDENTRNTNIVTAPPEQPGPAEEKLVSLNATQPSLSADHFQSTTSWCATSTFIYCLALAYTMEYLPPIVFDRLLSLYTDHEGNPITRDSITQQTKAVASHCTVTGDQEFDTNTSSTPSKKKATPVAKRKAKDEPKPLPKGQKSIMAFFTKT